MQEDTGMQLIWDIRKKLNEERQTMSQEDWLQLMHQRAETVQKRIDEIRIQKAANELVSLTKKS